MPTLFELVLGELSERVARIDRPFAENLSSPDFGVFKQYPNEPDFQLPSAMTLALLFSAQLAIVIGCPKRWSR